MDLSKLSHRELVDLGGDVIREGERRAKEGGHDRLAKQLELLHAQAQRTAQMIKGDGLVQAFSGDDKDDPVVGP